MTDPELDYRQAIKVLNDALDEVKRVFPEYPDDPVAPIAEWSGDQRYAFDAFEAAGEAVIGAASKLPWLKSGR